MSGTDEANRAKKVEEAYKVIDIHLVQMTVDQQLLDTSYYGTCDPENADIWCAEHC